MVRAWSDQELLDQSALVVVGMPISSKDTSEQTKLGQNTVVGVETQFAVSKVLKGDRTVKTVTVHHYRFAGQTIASNGPELLAFDEKEKTPYRLFLVREKDGRYAPVAGQMDTELSVRPEPVLELTIATTAPRIRSANGLSFVITFHNRSPDQFVFGDSTNDLLLNGGELLGNGAQMWSNVAAELKNEAGAEIPVGLHWERAGHRRANLLSGRATARRETVTNLAGAGP